MDSRQINFYMMPKDIEEFEIWLKQRVDSVFLALPMYEEELRIIETLAISTKEKDMWLTVFLAPEHLLDKIIVKYVPAQEYYLIDNLKSPVMEFGRCYYDWENKKMRRGRLYYIKGYYDDNKEWKFKDESFLNWADEIFKWFRRHFKNQKLTGFEGWLVTKRTAEWVEKEGGELLQL